MNSIIDFRAYMIEKIQVLVEKYYQLHGHSIAVSYLKSLWTGSIFFDPNLAEVYNIIIGDLQLILIGISSQKLANLTC